MGSKNLKYTKETLTLFREVCAGMTTKERSAVESCRGCQEKLALGQVMIVLRRGKKQEVKMAFCSALCEEQYRLERVTKIKKDRINSG